MKINNYSNDLLFRTRPALSSPIQLSGTEVLGHERNGWRINNKTLSTDLNLKLLNFSV